MPTHTQVVGCCSQLRIQLEDLVVIFRHFDTAEEVMASCAHTIWINELTSGQRGGGAASYDAATEKGDAINI